jgi:hypothetical protein
MTSWTPSLANHTSVAFLFSLQVTGDQLAGNTLPILVERIQTSLALRATEQGIFLDRLAAQDTARPKPSATLSAGESYRRSSMQWMLASRG